MDTEIELRRLQSLFLWAVGGLLLFTLAANLFIGQQMRLVRRQLPGQRDAVIRNAMEFQKRDEPLVRKFVGTLQEFARTNRDFQPVLEQYRSALEPYFGAPDTLKGGHQTDASDPLKGGRPTNLPGTQKGGQRTNPPRTQKP